ncbi:hypothetical protein F5H01DRAFT_411071, partial [Linnemannia elongata]
RTSSLCLFYFFLPFSLLSWLSISLPSLSHTSPRTLAKAFIVSAHIFLFFLTLHTPTFLALHSFLSLPLSLFSFPTSPFPSAGPSLSPLHTLTTHHPHSHSFQQGAAWNSRSIIFHSPSSTTLNHNNTGGGTHQYQHLQQRQLITSDNCHGAVDLHS